jgi:hypothetical protein
MQFLSFEVENFKGIVHLDLDFYPRQQRNIYTIVGLNESGKTTVLESFNFTSYKTDLYHKTQPSVGSCPMIYITEYLNNPVEGKKPRTMLVHTVKELLAIPWVSRQAHPPFFLQFSLSARNELIVID